MSKAEFVSAVAREWKTSPRWKGVTRPYKAEDVYRLKGTVHREYSLAKHGADRLWQLFKDDPFVHVLSAVTGNQAIQQVKAGLKAIYVSGWQVAADMNNSLKMYPDQSLYPSDSVPFLIRRINHALMRADQIHHLKDDHTIYWMAPLVAGNRQVAPLIANNLRRQAWLPARVRWLSRPLRPRSRRSPRTTSSHPENPSPRPPAGAA